MELIIIKTSFSRAVILIFLISWLYGCVKKDDTNNNLVIVKKVVTNLSEYEMDSLEKYSSKDFIVNLKNRPITKNQWFSFLKKSLSDEKFLEKKIDSLKYTVLPNGDIKVVYHKSDWATKCLNIPDFIHIDIYSLKEDVIINLDKAVVNSELSDSISVANQEIFFEWAKSNNHYGLFSEDGSIVQENFFLYLKKYCEEKNEEPVFID